MKTTPDLDLDEAKSLQMKSCYIKKKGNSCYCKHKRVQNQTKYILEGYKKCLKISEFKIEVNYFLACNKHEIPMVKQKSSFAYIWW